MIDCGNCASVEDFNGQVIERKFLDSYVSDYNFIESSSSVSSYESDTSTAGEQNPAQKTLVYALYGLYPDRVDVTEIIRYLVNRSRCNSLRLPLPGQPQPQYWYNYFFGDPLPRKNKVLEIVFTTETNPQLQRSISPEDEHIHMKNLLV